MSDADDQMKIFEREFREDMARASLVDAAAMAEKEARDARAELRNRFAMAALTGLLMNGDRALPRPIDAAEWAYEYADAMLATREVGEGMGVIRKEGLHPPTVESTALVRHPSLINPAVPTRVMVLLDNTRLPENTPVLPDGTYVLKDCTVMWKPR
ncbi:MAG: hypothetical protein ACK5PF_05420 [bacterium]|jgi:hypothetical protein